jgi:hypothetical protein
MLTGKVISLDIGNRNMHLVQGRSRGNTAELEICAQARTPDGAFRDGQIADLPSLSKALRDLVRTSRATADRAVVCIKSTAIINREITVPMVKPEELQQLVSFEMEQYVPNSPTTTPWDSSYPTAPPRAEESSTNSGLRRAARAGRSWNELLKGAGSSPRHGHPRERARQARDTHPQAGDRHSAAGRHARHRRRRAVDLEHRRVHRLRIRTHRHRHLAGDKPAFSRLMQAGSRQMDAELITALRSIPPGSTSARPRPASRARAARSRRGFQRGRPGAHRALDL